MLNIENYLRIVGMTLSLKNGEWKITDARKSVDGFHYIIERFKSNGKIDYCTRFSIRRMGRMVLGEETTYYDILFEYNMFGRLSMEQLVNPNAFVDVICDKIRWIPQC
jgi:hypothetical protein